MKFCCVFCVLVVLLTTFSSCSKDDGKPTSTPTVTTGTVTDITSSTATVSGEITDDGNASITEAGFVYSTALVSPTTADDKLVVDESTGILTGTLEDLDPVTTYYVRAYAINKKGTAYGESVMFTTEVPPAPVNGLVAYYQFSSNTEDSFGIHDGVATSVEYQDITLGSADKAVQFSGANSFITLPDDFDYLNRTISFNFRAPTIPDFTAVMYTSDHSATEFGFTTISVSQFSGAKNVNMNVSNQLVRIPIVENIWYNVVVVVESKSYKYYLNGALSASGTFDTYIHSGDGLPNAILGSLRTTTSNYFTGQLDDLRVYNRALSAEEVGILSDYYHH